MDCRNNLSGKWSGAPMSKAQHGPAGSAVDPSSQLVMLLEDICKKGGKIQNEQRRRKQKQNEQRRRWETSETTLRSEKEQVLHGTANIPSAHEKPMLDMFY